MSEREPVAGGGESLADPQPSAGAVDTPLSRLGMLLHLVIGVASLVVAIKLVWWGAGEGFLYLILSLALISLLGWPIALLHFWVYRGLTRRAG